MKRVRARLDRAVAFLRRHCKIIIISTVGLLVLTELILRLFVVPTYPAIEVTVDRGNRNCIRPTPDSSKKFHKHGLMSDSVEHRVNHLGFRGPLPENGDVVTIVMVGNGLVYGTGLDEKHTLPQQLEDVLKAANPGVALEVLNLGFPEFNLEEQSLEFRRLASIIKPDIVIVMAGDDSMRAPTCAAAGLPVREFIQRILAIAQFIEMNTGSNPAFGLDSGYSVKQTKDIWNVVLSSFRSTVPDAVIMLATLNQIGGMRLDTRFSLVDLSAPVVNEQGRRVRTLYSENDLSAETVAATAARLAERINPIVPVRRRTVPDIISTTRH